MLGAIENNLVDTCCLALLDQALDYSEAQVNVARFYAAYSLPRLAPRNVLSTTTSSMCPT